MRNVKETILMKMGEIVLKGHNRHNFENAFRDNIKFRLKHIGKFSVYSSQSTVYVNYEGEEVSEFEESPMSLAYDACKKVFGAAGIVRAYVAKKDMADILDVTKTALREDLLAARTFKVEAKRSDKHFPLKSPDICRELGGDILEEFTHLKVDVQNPDITVNVEIREKAAFVHKGVMSGAGGMPVGTNGRALIMLSGGIDSPVAGIMIAKRGIALEAVHFHSYPYTSERAKEKVIELAKLMSEYTGTIKLHIVPFTQAQEAIRDHCTPDLYTIIMRRIMIKIAQRIAVENKCKALVSGESLGQVASQTIEAINVTNEATDMLIMRPCIGMDKQEIVELARKYGTYEKSCEPYEDCCTLFAPKHPQTKPKIEIVKYDERELDMEAIIDTAMAGVEIVQCRVR